MTSNLEDPLLDESQVSNRSDLSLDEKIDNKLEDLGGVGKFQWFTNSVFIAGLICSDFFFYQFGYLVQEPVYKCSYSDDSASDANIC